MTSPVRLQHPEVRCLNVQNLVSTFLSVYIITRQAALESGLCGHGNWRHINPLQSSCMLLLRACSACLKLDCNISLLLLSHSTVVLQTCSGVRRLRTKSPMARLLAKAWRGQATTRWRLHLAGLLLSSSHTQPSSSSKPHCFLHRVIAHGLAAASTACHVCACRVTSAVAMRIN